MSYLDRLVAARACERLVLDFATFVDARDYDAVALLFAEDGTFARPRAAAAVIEGRGAIRASFQSRPPDEITRHFVSNLRVDVLSVDQAQGAFYLVLHTAKQSDPAAELGAFGLPTDGRALIADIQDKYVRTHDGWRIAQRRGRIVMHT
jgi:ketosteroid isomerase-like protein